MKCFFLILFFLSIQLLNADSIEKDSSVTISNVAIDSSLTSKPISDVKVVLQKDTSYIQKKSFSQEAMNKYLASDDFNYREEYSFTSALDNFFEALKRYFIWLLEKLLGPIEADKLFDALPNRETVLYAITFILLTLIVLFFYKTKLRFLFYKSSKKKTSLNFVEDNIHEIDFVNDIVKAEEQKKYRLAIRLHFLALLKLLDTNEFIHWQSQKTNREYIGELNNATFKNSFEEIVTIFEYVWYGEFSPNEEQYQKAVATFSDLQRSIQQNQEKVIQ